VKAKKPLVQSNQFIMPNGHEATTGTGDTAYPWLIEGLFFYAAFAYVYFLCSRGLLNGLASGTN
jgi:ribonucleotide reductase beta subunit family protein with ferritin-like domain